LIKNQ